MILAEVPKYKQYKIVKMPHYPLFQAMGLKEGQSIFVASRGLLKGPTIVKSKGRHYAIGRELAMQIKVKEVKNDE